MYTTLRCCLLTIITLSTYSTAYAQLDWRDVGDILQIALPASAYSTTLFHKDFQGTWEYTEALSTTMGSAFALKYTVQRERPNGSVRSFPSGHTAAAFSAAGFLERRYGWWYGIPAFALASLTGYSRVKSNQHWTSDVLAGAAIGIATNFYFTDRYHLTPIVGDDTTGIQIEIPF